MASAKGLILEAVGRFALKEGIVQEVTQLTEHVRVISVHGSGLRRVDWAPGDKIQVLLPGRDVRTYTPSTWNRDTGLMEVVAYVHGDTPGSRWARGVRTGDSFRFVGPQGALERDRRRDCILFGDETSLGLALALAGAARDKQLRCIFEVGARAELETAVAALAFPAHVKVTLVERAPGDLHVAEAAAAVQSALLATANAELLLSGRAQSIQAVRALLQTRGRSKAHWSVGKTGLD